MLNKKSLYSKIDQKKKIVRNERLDENIQNYFIGVYFAPVI